MKKSQLNIIEDGIKLNINDARNTIIQMKQYLYCIYELLLRIIDNLMKITHDTDNENSFNNTNYNTVILLLSLLVTEIKTIVNNTQYNGRKLLSDNKESIIFRLTNNIGYCRSVQLNMNDLIINLPKVGLISLGINGFEGDLSNLLP